MDQASFTSRQMHQFRELLAALDQLPPSPEANRRKRPRVNVRLPLRVRLFSSPMMPEYSVYSRNVSSSGLAFLSHRTFQDNEPLVVFLPVPGSSRAILCNVSFCRYLHAGVCEVGVIFKEAIQAGNLDRLPAKWRGLAPSDRLVTHA